MKKFSFSFNIIFNVLILLVTALLTTQYLGAQGWYNASWQHRRPVTIAGSGTGPLQFFQVKITLDNSDFANTQPGGSDLLVTSDDGITLIPFWIESWTEEEKSIWIKVPNIPTSGTTVYLYYGNPSPSIPSDPVETPPVGPFTRAINNPITPIGATATNLLAENIVFDQVTNHYWMCLANYSDKAISLCYSDTPSDPGSWNWAGNVITSFNNFMAGAPHLLLYNGIWYLFYSDRPNIMVATASNVAGPYSNISTVLQPSGPSPAWDFYRVDEPYVFQRSDGVWIMLYMGDAGVVGDFIEQVGYATSNNIMGPYTPYAGNPVIRFGAPGSYDAGTIADPWVYYSMGKYYIGYAVSPTRHEPFSTGGATTTDWQTFTKTGLIFPCASSGWDAANSFRGAISLDREGDTYLFTYTGGGAGGDFHMGIATQPVFIASSGIINNPDAVFDFYDSFNNGSTLDRAKWTFTNGFEYQANVAGGNLTITGDETSPFVRISGNSSFGMNYMVEVRSSHPDQGTLNMCAEVGFTDQNWNTVRILDDYPEITTHWQREAKLSNSGDQFQTMAQTAGKGWYVFRIYRQGPNIAGYQINNETVETTSSYVPTMELPPFLMSYGAGNHFLVDWIRVRKWAGSDPVTEVGAEQFGFQWSGAKNTDWNTAGNWLYGVVPSSTVDVKIPNVTNDPVCDNLTIGPTSNLTIEGGGALTINGNLTNNGTLNLKSNSDGIASLQLDSYTDNGTENLQLFLTGGTPIGLPSNYRWHYISVPVLYPYVNLYDDVTPGFNDVTLNLARFDEGLYSGSAGNDMSGWIAYDGYRYSDEASVEGFSTLDLGEGYNYYSTADQLYTFSGTLNTGAMSIPLAYSGGSTPGSDVFGFNLLGNPFTCGINWDVISNSVDFPQNTSKAVFFTKDNIQYTYCNHVGVPDDATAHIPPMQGFFVKTYSSGNYLPIPLSAREHSSSPRYKGQGDVISLIRLAISENNKSDETVVRFDDYAKADIDYDFDATKMSWSSEIPCISSLRGTTNMTINGLPFPETVNDISLNLIVGQTANGNHTIKTKQLQGLDDYRISLTDKKDNITINLKTHPNFTFSAPESMISGRFVLKVEKISTGIDNPAFSDSQFKIYHAFDLLNIQTLSDEWDGLFGSVRLSNITGKIIAIYPNQEFSKSSIIHIHSPEIQGIYFVELTSGLKKVLGKVIIK